MGKLNFFLKPRSVAVIGASAVPGKVGYTVMDNMIKTNYKGTIYPINPRGGEILGWTAYKSPKDCPGEIDLAIMCIPSKFVVSSAVECGEKGVKGIICITAGFREVGGEGVKYEHDLVETCRKYGMRLIGPNVLGVMANGLNMTFASSTPKLGKIAMLSQSGAMLTAILDWSATQDIGFSHFISLGNKADVDEIDLIEEIIDDPETSILILYLESVNNGKKFMEVVSKATEKKPVVILKSGRSAAGKAAASSHTGALAGDDMSFDLAFEKAGVIRAHTMNELFDLATLFDKIQPPKGDKFTIITNAGGPGIVATDAFEDAGIGFTRYNEQTQVELKKLLPAEASIKNPVDIVGDAPPQRYYDAIVTSFKMETIENCAGALVLVTPQAQTDPDRVAEMLAGIKKDYPDRMIVSCFMGGVSMETPKKILEEASIPNYPFPEMAIKAIKEMIKYRNLQEEKRAAHAAKPVDVKLDIARIETIIAGARDEGRKNLMPSECSEIFTMLGIEHPKTMLAKSAEEAKKFSTIVGFPVVMKIVSPEIVHKSDCGGVKLFIKSEDEAAIAYEEIMNNAATRGPSGARLIGCEIQKMVDFKKHAKVTELILGMNRDPQFGPLLMVGSGGIYANYIKDVAFQMATNYTAAAARKQILSTKVGRILEGVRGEPASDIEGVVDCLTRLAVLVTQVDSIKELDMNPLLVFEKSETEVGYSAIDIKIMIQ